jgi:hypothetical protein
MTRPEIEALLEGAYFPDNETREAVIARVGEAIEQAKRDTAQAAMRAVQQGFRQQRQIIQPLPKGPAND